MDKFKYKLPEEPKIYTNIEEIKNLSSNKILLSPIINGVDCLIINKKFYFKSGKEINNKKLSTLYSELLQKTYALKAICECTLKIKDILNESEEYTVDILEKDKDFKKAYIIINDCFITTAKNINFKTRMTILKKSLENCSKKALIRLQTEFNISENKEELYKLIKHYITVYDSISIITSNHIYGFNEKNKIILTNNIFISSDISYTTELNYFKPKDEIINSLTIHINNEDYFLDISTVPINLLHKLLKYLKKDIKIIFYFTKALINDKKIAKLIKILPCLD